jgi:L-lactate dehydrogenase complex protein LldF
MPLFGRKRREARRALANPNLQAALKRASAGHFAKFAGTRGEVPWEEIKDRARKIREECLPRLIDLIGMFSAEATKAGARVHAASTPEEALATIAGILEKRGAKLVAKAKSMVSEEIGLNAYLESRGFKVVETDLGEWIIQLAGERPSHITAPALHKTKEEVAELFSKVLGRPVPAEIPALVKIARTELRRVFLEADAGISGANLAVAESGTLILVSNEGNARLVTTLPPVHIALITTEKFVETLEQATTLLKALIIGSSGLKMTSYVSFITGPSKTTDIEKELVTGVHGPEELHIVILDNGRLEASLDKDLAEILYCLKCGGCMLQCPVFKAVGGHAYGGPVYPGGIGVLMTAVTRSPEEARDLLALCADCKKCEDFCPVGIRTGEILLKIKAGEKPKAAERLISGIFRRTRTAEAWARVFSVVQKIWMKDGRFRKLPTVWARGKHFPALKPARRGKAGIQQMPGALVPGNYPGTSTAKADPQAELGAPIAAPAAVAGDAPEKIYLFQGCLARFFFPELRESVLRTLRGLGLEAVCPESQVCCGAPSRHLGDEKAVRDLAAENLRSFAAEDPDFILTICPTGNGVLKKLYPQLDPAAAAWAEKTRDFSEFMVERGYLPAVPPGAKGSLLYHVPCHYLNELDPKEPLELLGGLGYAPKTEDEPASCCGFCGVFSVKNPEIAAKLWEEKKARIEASGETLIATDCPGCVFQLRSGLADSEKDYRVVHTAELCAREIAGGPAE